MPHRDTSPYDVVIAGGGITGLYTAWRFATSSNGVDPRRIAIFEASGRTGGRIWSHQMTNDESATAELGAMFFSDGQSLVYDLSTSVFGLDTEPVQPSPQIAYVRGERFRINDLPNLDVVPYNFAPDERGLSYYAIMFRALRRIVPQLDELWPLDPEADFQGTVRYLRQLHIEGIPLYRWGFWNLMARATSNESQACILDMVSIRSFLGNWNACDAILSMLRNLTGNWHKLSGGYQVLPDTIMEELNKLGVSVRRNCRLTGIHDGPGTNELQLELEAKGDQIQVACRRAVLTFPKAAYSNLDPTSIIFSDEELEDCLNAVSPVPCCKVFMTFDHPWWENLKFGPGSIDPSTLAKSHTDLPIRQCYYHSTPDYGEDSLLMTAFCDGDAAQFWQILVNHSEECKDAVIMPLSRNATEAIREQLSEMHDTHVPAPREALFVDWGSEGYGGGWHVWEPGYQSEQIMTKLQQPYPERQVHICGEAFSAYQGWTEGSLSSAEAMLQARCGLEHPEWLTSSDSLVPYDIQ